MEIINVRINNVTVGWDNEDGMSAKISFEGYSGSANMVFKLTNQTELQRLEKLMNYAGVDVNDVNNLNGRIVRLVIDGSPIIGYGDPIEDKFIPNMPWLGEELKEVTEAQLKELRKTK